jgi:murein DD-endopeptidase MepM/ murein hydrolase activator NlpD
MSDMQNGMNRALADLKGLHAALAEERSSRSVAQDALAAKQQELVEEREQLEDDRSLKNAVLVETESSELRYRYLLAELQREQQEADADIERLEKALREKIDVADRLGGGDTVLSWPVEPTRGISTRFHDPEYPFRYVYEHPGLDIRAAQGTPIRAPASGIVARAKDAGYGYSYIMLLHNNDITTVFGHVSKITAKEDTFVERGEIVGYSGGAPGTRGAGRMTTGPHLHFEVRKGGIPVDPMGYLVNL